MNSATESRLWPNPAQIPQQTATFPSSFARFLHRIAMVGGDSAHFGGYAGTITFSVKVREPL
jgi:hypothetical protein